MSTTPATGSVTAIADAVTEAAKLASAVLGNKNTAAEQANSEAKKDQAVADQVSKDADAAAKGDPAALEKDLS